MRVTSSVQMSIHVYSLTSRMQQINSSRDQPVTPDGTLDLEGLPTSIVLRRNMPTTCNWPAGAAGLPYTAAGLMTVGGSFTCPAVMPLPSTGGTVKACGPRVLLTATVCSGGVLEGGYFEADASTLPALAVLVGAMGSSPSQPTAASVVGWLPDRLNVSFTFIGSRDTDPGTIGADFRDSLAIDLTSPVDEQTWTAPGIASALQEGAPVGIRVADTPHRLLRGVSASAQIVRIPVATLAASAVAGLPSVSIDSFVGLQLPDGYTAQEDSDAIITGDASRPLAGAAALAEMDSAATGGKGAVCVRVTVGASVVAPIEQSVGSGDMSFVSVDAAAAASSRDSDHVASSIRLGDAATDLSLEQCDASAAAIPGGSGGGVDVGILVDDAAIAAASGVGQHPMSVRAGLLLNSPPAVSAEAPFPDGQSTLSLASLPDPALSITVPVQPAVGEAVIVACLPHSLPGGSTGESKGSMRTPVDSFIANPPVVVVTRSDARWEAEGHVQTSARVMVQFKNQLDTAPEGVDLRAWVVCVIASTEPGAAEALAGTAASRPMPKVLPDDLAALPGPIVSAMVMQPIAVAMPVRSIPVRWPRPSDVLSRLPDAVWGTAVGGATNDAPAPGSAAALLGRTSRYVSGWGSARSSQAATGQARDSAGSRRLARLPHDTRDVRILQLGQNSSTATDPA